MLLYYPLWMFMGFILHIYIIFETNLLTRPQPVLLFFAYFSISKKRNIKRSPNGKKPWGAWFLEWTWSGELGVQVKQQTRRTRDRRARPCLLGPTSGHRHTSSSYIYLHTPKTSKEQPKHNFHCLNLLYPWDPILGPSPALRRRASTSTP